MSYPKHAYPSARAFKAKKRRDLRYAMKALDELRLGCAYMPAHELIVAAAEALEKARSELSVKAWGR